MTKRSFILLLSGFKGLIVLQTAIQEDIRPKFVVIGRDDHVKCDYSENLVKLCEKYHIHFTYDLNIEAVSEDDIVLAIAWRKLIYGISKNLIIFHDSILPKYRGFSPLVNMLINGETAIGVTVIYAANEYDAGPIIFHEKTNIEYPITINAAIILVSELYKNLSRKIFLSTLNPLTLESQQQLVSEVSYSVWRDNEDYKINWESDAQSIQRHIDAVGYPYRGAYTMMNGDMIRITSAEVIPDVIIENRCPGKVLFNTDGYPVVICGSGLLKLLEAHIERAHIDEQFLPTPKLKMRFT